MTKTNIIVDNLTAIENVTAEPKIFYECCHVEIGKIAINSKPTIISRGPSTGYSLPIWDSGANADEEIYGDTVAPSGWDGVSNPTIKLRGSLDTANTDKKFKIQILWDHLTIGTDTPDTGHTVEVETDTATATQWKSFMVELPLDYDIDGVGNEMKVGERLTFRIRRVAATADEITGEFIIAPPWIAWQRTII